MEPKLNYSPEHVKHRLGLREKWKVNFYATIAKEISRTTRYFKTTIQISPYDQDTGQLLEHIDCPNKTILTDIPNADTSIDADGRALLLNGNLNCSYDAQEILSTICNQMGRFDRLIVVLYNPYFRWMFTFFSLMGLRKGPQPTTFLTQVDLENISRLSGLRIVRMRPSVICPFSFLGFGQILNKIAPAIPIIRLLCFTSVVTLQINSSKQKQSTSPSLSVVIPARNEKGNIENAVLRMPQIAGEIEIIFVEGHSSDNTWDEILRVQEKYNHLKIKAYRQSGKGKADAVRVGFKHASHSLLTILDADLTMPPEDLPKFYDAYVNGLADFINGSRLVYPMEGEAMRPLNLMGNVGFAKALSSVLNISIGDSLCGTKLVRKIDYERITSWRNDFGNFDPFGDFELIFPAATLALGFQDIPIRYRARTYGETNISRFRHGWMLLKMTLVGFFKIKLASIP